MTALLVATCIAFSSVPDGGTPSTVIPDEPPSAESVLAARALWLGVEASLLMQDDLFPAQAEADDPWWGPDKLMHFGVSFMLTLSTQYFLSHQMDLPNDRAWPVSAGTALAFGVFKELADSQRDRHPLFSWRDMAWNAAGVAVAVGVILM